MGSRRMFSKKVVETGKFLRLPESAQLLYFHLGMYADDDGFVEAFTVLRLTGCDESELELLEDKGLIKVYNEDLVTHITDWKLNNEIRKDRKVDSIYKGLLEEDSEEDPAPDPGNKEESEDLATSENADVESSEDICQPSANQMTTNCQPNAAISKVKLSKDNLINIHRSESGDDKKIKSFIDYQSIVDLYHSICPSLPKVQKITDRRKKMIKGILSKYDPEEIALVFEKAEKSAFLRGECNGPGHQRFIANFEWLINETNFVKVLEGNYDRRGQPVMGGTDYGSMERLLLEN